MLRRPLDIGHMPDSQRQLRVAVPMPTWEDFISVALDEIIATPTSSTHLRQRLQRLLEELTELAPPDAHAVLRTRLDDRTVNRTRKVHRFQDLKSAPRGDPEPANCVWARNSRSACGPRFNGFPRRRPGHYSPNSST